MDQQNGMIVRPQAGTGTQLARQGFGEQALERRDSASIAMAERARAEVQARCIMALQRPRSLDAVRVRVLDHCKRPRFAEKAKYAKPVGKDKDTGEQKFIEGASIRFVEAALVEYGNVFPECSVAYEDDERVVIQVSVTDLEKNITHAVQATVYKRVERRFLKKGQRALGERRNSYGDVVYLVEATDDDVANLKASRESKLLRNLGLRILPADIVEEAMDLCEETMARKDAEDPDAARKRLVSGFHGVGVGPEDLVEYLGHDLAKIVPAELADLRAVFAAIRDGETTWQEALAAHRPPASDEKPPAAPAPARGNEAAKAKIASRKKAVEPAAPGASKPAPLAGEKEPEEIFADPAKHVADEFEKEIRSLSDGLEVVLAEPHRLPGLRDRIGRLPPGVDKVRLEALLEKSERLIAEDRAKDEIPFG